MSRFEKIAAKLPEYGIDAVLVTGSANRLYATGFPSSAGAALVTGKGSWFVTDCRYIEAARKRITGAEIIECTAERSTRKILAGIVKEKGLKKVGFEERYMTVEEYRLWEKELDCELADANKLLMELRSAKEQGEIDCLIGAQRIAEKALTETLDFIKAGRTEQEISAYLQYRMLCGGAEKMSFEPIVVSGPNGSMPHGVPSAKPVAEGEFITIDFGCVWGGYCSDTTRTVAVGHVTEEMDKVYHTVLQAQLAGIAVAKAGAAGKAVHEAAAKVIGGAGYGEYFGHGFGHGVGVEIHEEPTASERNAKPLPEGAVISAEPGIYIPGRFGVRIEDVLVITRDGNIDITEAPKELIIL